MAAEHHSTRNDDAIALGLGSGPGADTAGDDCGIRCKLALGGPSIYSGWSYR